MPGQEWNVKARSDACRLCEKCFEDHETFNTVLSLSDKDCQRTDICESCWNDQEHRAGAVSVWKSVFRLPPPKSDEPLKRETSESLLRKLIETNDERNRDIIFVLAVDLERRRIFEERDIELRDDGRKNRVYEHKKTGEAFIICDPDLNLRELEDVQGRVLELLLSGDNQVTADEAQPVENVEADA